VPDQGSNTLYYAKKESQATVFTVDIDFLNTLESAQIGLRDRHLFSGTEENVQSITLSKSGSNSVLLQKLENGAWQVGSRGVDQSLQTMPGDPTIITNFLRRLLWSDALPDIGFVSDAPSAADLEKYGLELPLWRVDVSSKLQSSDTQETEKEESDEVDLLSESIAFGLFEGGETNHVYAKMSNSPSVYLLDSSILRELRTTPNHYRNRLLPGIPKGAKINTFKITSLEDAESLLSIDTTEEETSWEDELAKLEEPQKEAIIDLLQSLETFQAKAFLHNKFTSSVDFAGKTQPWSFLLEVSITPQGGDETQATPFSLHLAETTGGATLLAGSTELNLVFETDQAFLDAFTTIVSQRPEPEKSEDSDEIAEETSSLEESTPPEEEIEREEPLITTPLSQ
jgi:hypothetical protein